jgi:hypothetical protein
VLTVPPSGLSPAERPEPDEKAQITTTSGAIAHAVE